MFVNAHDIIVCAGLHHRASSGSAGNAPWADAFTNAASSSRMHVAAHSIQVSQESSVCAGIHHRPTSGSASNPSGADAGTNAVPAGATAGQHPPAASWRIWPCQSISTGRNYLCFSNCWSITVSYCTGELSSLQGSKQEKCLQ